MFDLLISLEKKSVSFMWPSPRPIHIAHPPRPAEQDGQEDTSGQVNYLKKYEGRKATNPEP